ncbi:hypothetical protein [Desulfotalea psychrophila]|uniref:hypothetical protein n=1 Tax=Desulfotalea psychrophila TaxID=84980 RepID=UPI001D17478E|nr:hypothetical protein [Desulfotalea psychrophila]
MSKALGLAVYSIDHKLNGRRFQGLLRRYCGKYNYHKYCKTLEAIRRTRQATNQLLQNYRSHEQY